jgi:hypothetical protein
MPAPDPLLDFDTGILADYDPARVRQALREHPAVYANQLQIAHWLQGWADRLQTEFLTQGDDTDVDVIHALREIAAHPRQADLVPGGPLRRNGRNIQRQLPPT